ncbi:hypothetical protein D3C80_938340 [compost metagenome]
MNRHEKIAAVNNGLPKTMTFESRGRSFAYKAFGQVVRLTELTQTVFEDLTVAELIKFGAEAEALCAERSDGDDDRVGIIAYSYVYTSNKPGEAEEVRSTVHVTNGERDPMQIDDHVANAYRVCRVTKENAAVYIEKYHNGNPNHRNLIVRFVWSDKHQLPLYDCSAHDIKQAELMASLSRKH